ncbi:MAG TPA: hypothetical protein VEP90_25595, partial [Methylomirabilota bacterium]|nr:hypothetical protein [Methylomirabilota bacterium]
LMSYHYLLKHNAINVLTRLTSSVRRISKNVDLIHTKVSATRTKIELVYSGITERTWTNTIIIYFNWIFAKNVAMNINFFRYFFYIQYLSHLVAFSASYSTSSL